MIKLTTDHPTPTCGMPIFSNAAGTPLTYASGLRQLREERGWSTRDIANITGASPRTVEGWEQRRHKPPKSALMLLAAELDRLNNEVG